MKTVIFSKPLSAQWSEYSKNYKKYKETTLQYFKRKNRNILTNPLLTPERRQIDTFCLDLWAADANKKLLHLYFVDRSLYEFLENVKLPDLNGIIEYIKDNGFSSKQKILLPNGKPLTVSEEETSYYSFGIHIPNVSKESGYAFSFMMNKNKEIALIWVIGRDRGWCPIKKYKDLLKEESKNSKEIVKIIQFAVNTVAYMNTFPGCVIDGVPEIIKKQPFYNDNSLYVDISDKIVDYSENTNIGKKVSPHFRRGYFKRLTAERYTKMRGKLIFVHGFCLRLGRDR